MPHWWIKAGLQGALSALPRPDRVNALLQRRLTGRLELTPARFEAKLRQARRHLRHYAKAAGTDEPPAAALELGTGWYPIVPVALALCGVRRVITVDITPLVTPERTREALAHFAGRADLRKLLPRLAADAHERLAAAVAAGSLEPLGIELRLGDARATGLPSGSIDLFVSNNTLEHIPEDVLAGLMREFARLASPGAVMDHFIDMRDHYADFDASLNRLNYLRYPDPVWRLFNNRLQYQSRLRLPDYRSLVTAQGFRIVAERATGGREGEFDELTVARRFREVPREERETLFVWLTAQRDGGSRQPPVSPL